MENFLVTLLIVILLVRWLVLRGKIKQLETDLRHLARRVLDLESGPVPAIPQEAVVAPAAPVQAKAPSEAPFFEKPVVPRLVPIDETPEPSAPVRGPFEIPTPALTLTERFRNFLGQDEWEALLGGSLLNKIGALVLVIGIALFLGYSFTHMTPAGRALTCVAASWTLLGAGVFIERRLHYRVFARGLIGAGWAALYVTAYAIYAVPAARLIDNAFAGSLLLLIVAVGMIGHSLLYRTQAVTAVAYFAAFAALGVTPSSSFGLVALLPLAGSLLYLAYRSGWNAMAVFGVVATYVSCIWRGGSGASLFAVEALLVVYWLLFEGFDLLRVQKQKRGGGLEYVFPLNAFSFLGLSYQAWLAKDPAHLWSGCVYAALLYLASAAARWFLRPQDRTLQLDGLPARVKEGSFEAPLALSAVLTGAAITLRATGVWLSAGLAMEAEVLYFAGVMLDLAFLRALGRIGFGSSLARLIFNDIATDEIVPGTAAGVRAWTPVALFHAFLFYLNRVLRTPNSIFSSLAAALIAGVLARELPHRFVGAAWLVFAALLFELGLRKLRTEFRFQAYVLAAGGVALNIGFNALASWAHPWIPLTLSLCIVYGIFLRLRLGPALPRQEQKMLGIAVAVAITSLSMLLVWRLSPANYKGVCLCGLALILFELGVRQLPAQLINCSYAAMAIAASVVALEHATEFVKFPHADVWLSYLGATIVLYLFSERSGARLAQVRVTASMTAALFLLCTVWLVAPNSFVAVCWAAFGLLLFQSGVWRNRDWERLQAYLITGLAVFHAASLSFPWASILVAALCFAGEFLSPSKLTLFPLEKHVRAAWSIAGTFVLTALLWEQFPGGLLTTMWGIQGVVLLSAGFVARERILRLEGLALLLLCILKLFLYDLRSLETPYRILSFIALGVILLAVSSIYSRFRNQIKRHL